MAKQPSVKQSFLDRFWRMPDWESQINRIIGFTNIARITILFTLMMLSAFASESRDMVDIIKNTHGESTSLPVVMTYLQSYWVKVWFAVYSALVLMGIVYPNWQKQNRWETPNISAVADISMMVLLMHLLGGVSSGFGILVLPFLSVSCLLSYGRYALLYASYASSLIIISMFVYYFPINDNMHTYIGTFANNATLIAGCYLVSLFTSFSASYLSSARESVQKHRIAFERVNALNQVVVNRMQEAVVVVDDKRLVWLHNRQALQYFHGLKVGREAPFTKELVRRWYSNKRQSFETNIMVNQSDMNIRAIPVHQESTELLILFIRAEKERQAEAQSVKLASLGLLTANLAHEIRNPLSAIRQANGLLTELGEEDKMTSRLCSIIDKNIARVDKMIEEVSTLNKSDRMNREHIHLETFWRQFQQEFLLTRPEATGHIKVEISSLAEAIFDPMHLQQILWNLCNNAWRHSSQQSKHAIGIQIITPENDFISIRVSDDGAKIPEDIQAHLFDPFFTTQTQSEGTGLGLYVARELAHANKGDLRYIAHPKAFELILPRARYD